jgi:two-component sensor histidine kinase
MLSLQLADAESESTSRILTDARNRIDALAMVHRSLQESLHLDRADAADFLNEMVRAIVAGIGSSEVKIDTRVDVSAVELPPRLLVSIGLIVNELVTNAVVHGLTPVGGGILAVSFQAHEGGGYLLTVRDSGVGMGGAAPETESSSLGLTLVRTIAGDQLGAEFNVTAAEEGGTVARVVIPAQPELRAGS